MVDVGLHVRISDKASYRSGSTPSSDAQRLPKALSLVINDFHNLA